MGFSGAIWALGSLELRASAGHERVGLGFFGVLLSYFLGKNCVNANCHFYKANIYINYYFINLNNFLSCSQLVLTSEWQVFFCQILFSDTFISKSSINNPYNILFKLLY